MAAGDGDAPCGVAAPGLVESGGGGAEVFTATVTSNGGKRVEKVTITKLGNQYFAQRDNEPGIYEVDGKVVDELLKAAADVKEAAPETPKPKKK